MKRRLLIVHPFSPYEPGRFLEDALQAIGYQFSLFTHGIDFGGVNQKLYDAVLFIESPWRTFAPVVNIQLVKIPRFYWAVHGESRLTFNVQKAREYRANCVLLANSFHLTPHYGGIPCYPLMMAADLRYFKYNRPIIQRHYDVSFIGSFTPACYYGERNRLMDVIKAHFPLCKLHFTDGKYLDQMGQIYGNSKIVFNWNYMNILTARPFEAMASNALLMTNFAHGMEQLGKNRWDFVYYRNDADLVNKIQFYLSNLDKLQKVSTHGYRRILTANTYIHRARQLEQILAMFVR